MNRLIFLNDQWVSVTLPKGCDPTWVEADFYTYASCWAQATSKGFSNLRSQQLAEAFVSKRLYPGLVYDRNLEKDLNALLTTE
jgi:hypothetical protein